MRFREVLRYELCLRLASPSTWLLGVFLFLVAMWMLLATADGGGAVHVNAPARLVAGAAIVGSVGMLVSAALFGVAATRDAAAGMEAQLFTTPQRKRDHLGGRFLAALGVNAILLAVVPLGFVAATRLIGPFGAGDVGAFRLGAFAQPYALILLPNAVFAGAILFAIGAVARRTLPVYLGAIGLFVGFLTARGMIGADSGPLGVLTDPLGLRALERATRYWTTVDRNARLVGLPAELLWNRLTWLAVAGAVLALLHARFRFAQAGGGVGRRRARHVASVASQPELPGRVGPVAVPRSAGAFDRWTPARQVLAEAGRALRETASARSFAFVIAGCALVTLLVGWEVGDGRFETSVWPVTFLIVETVLSERMVPILYALIVVYAGELVWKDRDAGLDELVDAAPVPGGALLVGRFLALVALIATFQLALLLGGVLIQALQGYTHFELGLYLRALFGLDLVHYAVVAALAIAVHVVVDHKYLAHAAALLLLVGTRALRMLGVVEHNLLLFNGAPGWTYSDMNGFGPFVAPYLWFEAYWAGWALLLGVLSTLAWVRGRERAVRRRLAAARARFGVPLRRAAGVAAAWIVLVGAFVFYNTNVLNAYRSREELGADRAAYEQRHAQYESAPQPTLVRADLRFEIHPDERRVDLAGTYRLVNRTDARIEAIHVVTSPEVATRLLAFDRETEPALVDDETGFRAFALAEPLEPGASTELAFECSFRSRGFRNDGNPTDVVTNGAYFNRRWLPFIGYQPLFELADGEARARFGLGPPPPLPGPEDEAARRRRWPVRNEDLVEYEIVIGTDPDQVAVTPGVLRREWREDGRRWFHYASEGPTAFGAAVVSAELDTVESRWNDVELAVLHHPAHGAAAPRLLEALETSLGHYSAWFGPYPHSALRIVEVPRYGGFGHAHPLTIAFTEDVFLGRVREGELDLASFGTAHEVAHTWWGGLVRGAPVRGQELLSESLANYSAMAVAAESFGPDAVRRIHDFQLDRYMMRRSAFATDVPLVDVEDHPHIAYGKGAIAFWLLRERIGAEALHGALRRYFERFADAGPPFPVAADLVAELRAAAPDDAQDLITDLFETMTLWDLSTQRAVVEADGTGAFRVTLELAARKLRADEVGNESEAPLDEWIEIGVFGAGDAGRGEPLHLERHRIRSGSQSITVTVPAAPAFAGIDPHRKWIDREPDDNVVAVVSAATP